MTFFRVQLTQSALIVLLISSCTTIPKLSYHSTTIHIPDVQDKGDFSAFGTIGSYHSELQLAYSPINNWIVQASTMLGGDARYGGEKRSYEFGLGYQFKPNTDNTITLRGFFGNHRHNNRLFDPPSERCGNDFEGYLQEFDYKFNNWAFQTDYVFTKDAASLIFGSKLIRANYSHAYMIDLQGTSDYNIFESRNNFHSYFISTSMGVNFRLSNRFSFTSYISITNEIGGAKANTLGNEFNHRFNQMLWSNGLTFTVKPKKQNNPKE